MRGRHAHTGTAGAVRGQKVPPMVLGALVALVAVCGIVGLLRGGGGGGGGEGGREEGLPGRALSGSADASSSSGGCHYTDEEVSGPVGVDYMHFFRCGLGSKSMEPLSLTLLICWFALLVYLLGHTADAYFSPTLEAICDKLDVPYDIAGVTFLAFGNGAPDVFASLAGFSSSADALIGVGALLGANMFVSTVIVGILTLIGDAPLTPWSFIRDVAFNILAVSMLTGFLWHGEITLMMAFSFIIVYASFVGLVGLMLYLAKTSQEEETNGSVAGVIGAFWHSHTPDFDDGELSTVEFSSLTDSSHDGSGTELTPQPHYSVLNPRAEEWFYYSSTHDEYSSLAQAASAGSDDDDDEGDEVNLDAPRGRSAGPPAPQAGRTPPRSRTASGGRQPMLQPYRPVGDVEGAAPSPASSSASSMLKNGTDAADQIFEHGMGTGDDEDVLKPSNNQFNASLIQDYFPPGGGAPATAPSGVAAAPLPGNGLPAPPARVVHSDSVRDQYGHGGGDRNGDDQGGAGNRGASASVWSSLYWQHWRWRRQMKRQVFNEEWRTASVPMKLVRIAEAPFVLARNITIPAVEDETWSRLLAMGYPIFSPQFLLFAGGMYGAKVGLMPLWAFMLIPGVLLAVVVHLCTHTSHAPRSLAYSLIFVFGSFVMSIAWIYVIAGEMVAVLELFGTISGLPLSVLGLTVLAWGNSVGDLITNISVANKGFGDMAIAGCYGGPIFNILVGAGMSLFFATFKSYPEPFTISLDTATEVSAIFLISILAGSLIVVSLHNFVLSRSIAIALLCAYAVYTLTQILLLV